MDTITLSDPAHFARALRDVARETHEALKHEPTPARLGQLSRRLDALTTALGDRHQGPLGAWLENAGRQVRSAAIQRDRAARRLCRCA